LAWAAKDDTAAQNIKDFCDPATRNLITRALSTRDISSQTSLSATVVSNLRTAKLEEERLKAASPVTPK